MGGDAQLLLVASTRCSEVVVDSGRSATTTSLGVCCNVGKASFLSDVINFRLSRVITPSGLFVQK
jgi:hypothetical protein